MKKEAIENKLNLAFKNRLTVKIFVIENGNKLNAKGKINRIGNDDVDIVTFESSRIRSITTFERKDIIDVKLTDFE